MSCNLQGFSVDEITDKCDRIVEGYLGISVTGNWHLRLNEQQQQRIMVI